MHFLLASPATYDSAHAAAATHVAVALLEDVLCETAYLAEVAGLSYEARAWHSLTLARLLPYMCNSSSSAPA